MSQSDPYAAPGASLDVPDHPGAVRYGGFWRRAGAYLIDFLLVSPLIALDYFFGGSSERFALYMLVPGQLLSAFLYLYMVVKFGATPGKLAMGMRIVKLDGSPVTLKEAALRYCVVWVLSLLMSLMMIYAAMNMPDNSHLALSYMERSAALGAAAPNIMKVNVMLQLWVIACIVSIVATKQCRAVHDFIAGTIVIRK